MSNRAATLIQWVRTPVSLVPLLALMLDPTRQFDVLTHDDRLRDGTCAMQKENRNPYHYSLAIPAYAE